MSTSLDRRRACQRLGTHILSSGEIRRYVPKLTSRQQLRFRSNEILIRGNGTLQCATRLLTDSPQEKNINGWIRSILLCVGYCTAPPKLYRRPCTVNRFEEEAPSGTDSDVQISLCEQKAGLWNSVQPGAILVRWRFSIRSPKYDAYQADVSLWN